MHAYVCVCVCAHVCMHACAHVSVSEWMKLHKGEGNAEMVQSIFIFLNNWKQMVLTAMHNGGKIITDAYNLNQTNIRHTVPENVI